LLLVSYLGDTLYHTRVQGIKLCSFPASIQCIWS